MSWTLDRYGAPVLQCDSNQVVTAHARRAHPAEGWLLAPDGRRVPGGWMCEDLAREVIAEYDGSGYDGLRGFSFEDTRPVE